MTAGTRIQQLLLALAVLAFMGQTLTAKAVHQHDQTAGQAAIEINTEAMAKAHHHHAMPAEQNSQIDHNQHAAMSPDCCEDQCECSAAHCSTFYGIANERLTLLSQHLQLPQLPTSTLTLAHRTSPFRPPIA